MVIFQRFVFENYEIGGYKYDKKYRYHQLVEKCGVLIY